MSPRAMDNRNPNPPLHRTRLIGTRKTRGRPTPALIRKKRVQWVNVQVAKADRGGTVVQTQTQTFEDLRTLARSRAELTEEDKRIINDVLTDLENTTKESGLAKRIERAKKDFAKYGWLLEPLVAVLKTILQLT